MRTAGRGHRLRSLTGALGDRLLHLSGRARRFPPLGFVPPAEWGRPALNAAKISDGPNINAWFPRSGHRFLREILCRNFAPELVFYESHQDAIIATDRAQRRLEQINYVKTHDFSLQGKAVLGESCPGRRRYLVQVRHPLESIACYYEFSLRPRAARFDNRLTWWIFLYAKRQFF